MAATAARTPTGDYVIIYGVYAGLSYTAKDGTNFAPAKFYDVASRNIGVLVTDPDGKRTAYANTLYAVPSLAEKKAQEMCAAHNAAI